MLFAAMNLPAFAIHTVCDCIEDLWIKAPNAKRARKRFFEHIRTIAAYLVFPDWQTLITTLIDCKLAYEKLGRARDLELLEGNDTSCSDGEIVAVIVRSILALQLHFYFQVGALCGCLMRSSP